METGTAQLNRSCKKLTRILRRLPLYPARQCLEFGDREYNPRGFDRELLRLGIQVHQLDIETGSISPPGQTFFLPRTDFPEFSDTCKEDWESLNDVWGEAVNEDFKGEDETNLFSDNPGLFPWTITSTFAGYSLEGEEYDTTQFEKTRPPEGVQPSRYGWMFDHEREDMRDNPRLKRNFEVFEIARSDLGYYQRNKLEPGVIVTRSSDGDGLLVDHGCHIWASWPIEQCGDTSRPSEDEIVALIYTMLDSMLCMKTSIHDVGPRSYNPEFPTILFLVDLSGKCRILSGYYDGRLHIALTRLLDFSEYALAAPAGMSYLDSIDQDKFYRMMSTLLKWAWPIALGGSNENEEIPVLKDLLTNVQPDEEEPEEEETDEEETEEEETDEEETDEEETDEEETDEEESDESNDDWVKV